MNDTLSPQRWKDQFAVSAKTLSHVQSENISGRIVKVTGLVMEAVGIKLPVGSGCLIHLQNGVKIEAEVVGFDGDRLFLMPQSDLDGVIPGAAVFPIVAPVHPDRLPFCRPRSETAACSHPRRLRRLQAPPGPLRRRDEPRWSLKSRRSPALPAAE